MFVKSGKGLQTFECQVGGVLVIQCRNEGKSLVLRSCYVHVPLHNSSTSQIMLGMVQPPQAIPNIQPAASQQPQLSAQPSRQSNIQAAQTLPGQGALQDQTSVSQSQPPMRKQHQSQPAMSISAPPGPPVNLQSQPLPSHPLHMPTAA
ncbi:hypothetical protein NC653_029114 [Populus alba x Populus x berolinensis]|uniref:Uncharacterized protein n=1 Tax=Populus alba x Populus x berolinensis TaxID=444605 RepID=A0AAD6M1B8_9ROSI|nr:hypothetical protein NC653_029114 [Populus alba x Populus x berolinensis]